MNLDKNIENAAHDPLWQLATVVRDACFAAATTAYDNARLDGLCHDGAWECAVDAMRSLNYEAVVTKLIASE
ncbi:MAG: hypothetical protein GY943_17670 [Chloroflexi bacterium]|nr:hypothetical protein [Chloroflexota bacterium]